MEKHITTIRQTPVYVAGSNPAAPTNKTQAAIYFFPRLVKVVKTTVQKTVSVGSIPTFGQKDVRLELISNLKNLTFNKKFDIIFIERQIVSEQ